MRLLKYLLIVLLALPIVAGVVIWIGSAMALDRSGAYATEVAALPLFDRTAPVADGLVQIGAGGMTFRARVAGFDAPPVVDDGEAPPKNVILLHGFPETSIMWEPLIRALAAQGYRVVAFDQRGYSPGARPESINDYVTPQLVGDVLTLAAVVGFQKFHLVGHDWGSAVGWVTTMAAPHQVLTYNAMSIPHVAAFGEALASDAEQREKSAYMGFFAMPWLPQRLFVFSDFNMLRSMYSTHSEATVAEYLKVFGEPGALSAALNWYRASALTASPEADATNSALNPNVERPVQFLWGNDDMAVSRKAVEMQVKYLKGNFREVELDAGHWLMEDAGPVVVESVVDFIRKHS